MKSRALATALTLALMTGCANQPEKRLVWEVKPVVDIRHGMAPAMARYQLGQFHQRQGNLHAAEAAFTEALAVDPHNAEALNALGKLYAERGDLDRSAEAFRRIANMGPRKAYLHNNIGYALYLQGRYGEAIEALRRAVTLNPDYDRAWVNLRAVAEEAGMSDLAELAARHRLPTAESPPLQDADACTQMAERPTSAEPPNVRLALTPTLKILTEPTTPALLFVAEPPAQPVALPITVVAGPNVRPTAATTQITLTEAGKATATTAATRGDLRVAEQERVRWVLDRPNVEIALPTFSVTSMSQEREPAAVAVAGRIEVSNGNGIGGFATLVGRELKKEGVRVSRITNHTSYRVERSYIECRPEWGDAAQTLRERLGAHVALRETKGERRGADIRVVLGRDSFVQVAKQPNPRRQEERQPLLLTLLAT